MHSFVYVVNCIINKMQPSVNSWTLDVGEKLILLTHRSIVALLFEQKDLIYSNFLQYFKEVKFAPVVLI